MTEVAVLRDLGAAYHVKPGDAPEGVVRLFQQLAVQFDLIPPRADWGRYALIVVPEAMEVDARLGRQLMDFIAGAGASCWPGRAR